MTKECDMFYSHVFLPSQRGRTAATSQMEAAGFVLITYNLVCYLLWIMTRLVPHGTIAALYVFIKPARIRSSRLDGVCTA